MSSLDNWDGRFSKPVKQKPTQTIELLDSSTGTSTLNDNVPTIGIRHGWQDMMDVNRTSNANQPLLRDALLPVSSGTVTSPNGITNFPSTQPARKTFMPIASSPLHKKTLGLSPVVPTPMVFTLAPVSVHLDKLETISTYTTDGEGDDEVGIEDVTVVHDMLATYSPSNTRTYCEQNVTHPNALSDNRLFTPPPPDEDTPSVNHLFTSSPSQTHVEPSVIHSQPRSRRLILSHIEVPRLKRPRSDYRPFLSSIVNRRRVFSGPPPSPQTALQAALEHNSNIGSLPYNSSENKKRKPTKRRNENTEKLVAAGSSLVPNSTGFGSAQVAGIKKPLRRSIMDDDDWGRAKKKPRPISQSIVLDLTISDDDEPAEVKPTPNPRPILNSISKPLPEPPPRRKSKFIHVAYNAEADVVTLCLEDIRPVPLEVLTLNTQFLRLSLGNDAIINKATVALGSKASKLAKFNINRTRQNGSRPCFLSIDANCSTKDAVEEISVGGVIWELPEEDEKEVIEISSDSDTTSKENVLQRHVDLPALSTSQVPLSKANLIKQRQKKPRAPHHSQQQGDDVDRSSSQYPKKESQQNQKNKQTSGASIKVLSTASNTPHKQAVAPPSLPRPPHSARSSLNGHNVESLSAHLNGVVPSAKALGKRRAISPTMTVSAATIPQQHLPVSSYFAASTHDLQLSSRRPSVSTPTYNPYVVENPDFNTFIDFPFPAAQPSSSEQANSADFINASSSSSSYNLLDTFGSLYESSSQNESGCHISTDMDASRHHLSPSPFVYNSRSQPESRRESFFSSTSSLYNDVGFPADQHDHQHNDKLQPPYDATIGDPWSSSLVTNHSEGQYVYDTIDPTLLGGGSLLGDAVVVESGLEPSLETDTELEVAEMGVEFDKEMDEQVQHKDSSELGYDSGFSKQSSPSPSSTDSSPSSSSVPPKKTHSTLQSISPSNDDASVDDTEHGKEETYWKKLPQRKRTKRVMPNMISHDDIDLLESIKPKRRFTSSSASLAPDAGSWSSESESSDKSDGGKRTIRKPTFGKPTIRKPVSGFTKDHISSKPDRARSNLPIEPKLPVPGAKQNRNQNWLMEESDSCCHQCRRKTFYAKMTCSDCQKKYCVRCYAFRYPECEFNVDDEEYSCPACEGFCNCTVCCRKRGDPYVGVRTCDKVPDSPPPIRPQRPRNKDAERVKPASQTNLTPPSIAILTTVAPKGVTQAWGTLYNATGEKIGACFFDPSAKESLVFTPAVNPIMSTITEVAAQQAVMAAPTNQPKPRAKVKKKKRRIFVGMVQPCWGYTRPKTTSLKPEPYSKRSYNEMPRYYIGKKKYLFYPVEQDESSLISMDESEKEPDGADDLDGKSFTPDSLGDGDVMRAILLGLNACGVAAIEMPTI